MSFLFCSLPFLPSLPPCTLVFADFEQQGPPPPHRMKKRKQPSHVLLTPKEKRQRNTNLAKQRNNKTTQQILYNIQIYIAPPGLAEIVMEYYSMVPPPLADVVVFVEKGVPERYAFPQCAQAGSGFFNKNVFPKYQVYINPKSKSGPRFYYKTIHAIIDTCSIRTVSPHIVHLNFKDMTDSNQSLPMFAKSAPVCSTINQQGTCACPLRVGQFRPVLYRTRNKTIMAPPIKRLYFDGFSNWVNQKTKTEKTPFAITQTKVTWKYY